MSSASLTSTSKILPFITGSFVTNPLFMYIQFTFFFLSPIVLVSFEERRLELVSFNSLISFFNLLISVFSLSIPLCLYFSVHFCCSLLVRSLNFLKVVCPPGLLISIFSVASLQSFCISAVKLSNSSLSLMYEVSGAICYNKIPMQPRIPYCMIGPITWK